MQLVSGVYQIKLPLTGVEMSDDDNTPIKARRGTLIKAIEQKVMQPSDLSHVNAYLIEGKNENLLIDTGWDSSESFTAFNKELKDSGFTLKDITRIVITHVHADHYGMAGKIKQLTNCSVAASEIEAGLLDARYVHMDDLLGQMKQYMVSHGVPPEAVEPLSQASLPMRKLVTPTMPDIKLKAGDKIKVDPFEFTVLLTPGHSPGHICLYEPKRKLLFTGDHILPEITPHIGFHPQSGPNPLGDYLDSLDAVFPLEVNFAFPGHGPAFSGMKQIIEGLFRHHDQRQATILKTIALDMKNAYQVAMEIAWRTDDEPTSFQSLNTFNQRLALLETVAHLEYLVNEDKAKKMVKDNVTQYFGGV
jgi:glyoxylase-like metal-dependent hydrolase (beta-lactamase superfamily II)